MAWSESEVSSNTLVYASSRGLRLMRNNNGAMQGPNGQVVRYGLRWPGKGSQKVNDEEKSPDFIAVVPIQITPDMVGHTVAVMGGFEIKPEGYPLERHLNNPNSRESSQKRWLDKLVKWGGIGGFVRSNEDVDRIINEFFARFKL